MISFWEKSGQPLMRDLFFLFRAALFALPLKTWTASERETFHVGFRVHVEHYTWRRTLRQLYS